MPHINRIRLVNVNFNDAKGIYDDFTMRLDGKSTTYDLMNTGGKSLLLLMLLQTVIPNTYLKKEKPVKNIFVGGNTKRTSHCLVEWILDEGYEYKYMLTGFCARKKQDSDSDANDETKLEIDYYNYCYFYNSNNENDIKNLPLATKDGNEKIFMSYDKLRQYLGNMKKEGLPVEIFDSKKDYMKRIEYYGLISAEWKLISEINVSENYIEKYFKENKTSRKLVENFLIKIIDNVNMQNEDENQLSDTLIELKDNLMKFRKQSDNKNEYIQVKELYSKLKQKNEELTEKFNELEKINKKAYEAFIFKKSEKDELKSKIQHETNEIDRLKNENSSLEIKNDKLKIDKLYNEIDSINNAKEELKKELLKVKKQKDDAKKQLALGRAQNEYIDYVEAKMNAEKTQIQIQNLSISETEHDKEYKKYGYNYKVKLEEKVKEFSTKLENQEVAKKEKIDANKIAKIQENNARDNLTKCSNIIEILDGQIKDKKDEIDGITQEFSNDGKMELLLNVEQGIEQEKLALEEINKNIENSNKEIEDLKFDSTQREKDISQIKANKTITQNQLEQNQIKIDDYESQKLSIEKLAKTFQVQLEYSSNNDLSENCKLNIKERIEDELQEREKEKNIIQIERQIKCRKLELIEKYNMIIPNEDILHLKEKLENRCSYVTTGIEKLMEVEESKRNAMIRNNPLLIYSVFIDDETFNKLKNKQIEIETQNLVPIASIEMLRLEKDYKQDGFIFPLQKEVYQSINESKIEEYKEKLINEISVADSKIAQMKQREENTTSYLNEVKDFIKKYPEEVLQQIYKQKVKIENKIKDLENELKTAHNIIQNNKEEIDRLNDFVGKTKLVEKELEKDIQNLQELKNAQEELTKLKEKINAKQKDEKAYKEIFDEKTEIRENLESELEEIKENVRKIEIQKNEYNTKLIKLQNFAKAEILMETFEKIQAHFEALDEKISTSRTEISNLQTIYNMSKSNMEKCKKSIEANDFELEYFSSQNQQFEKVLDSKLKDMETKIEILEKSYQGINDKVSEKEAEYNKIVGKIGISIEGLTQNGEKYVEADRIKENDIIEIYIKENSMKIKGNKGEINKLSQRIEDVNKQVRTLETECSRLEDFISDRGIESFEVDIQNMLRTEIYSYSTIRGESSKLDKMLEKQKGDFNDYMRHIKESVENFYIKQDVLDSIQEIKLPNKLDDCENIGNGINTIVDTLDEKLRHIEEALKNLEIYQENFITKCFEKAETIVRDLEKLPGLSKIKIGGKDVNIIKLDLFEYEKEEKIKKMKDYILKIVQEMEEKPEEMNKEQLNEKLSSKSLVAQIINMDKVNVKLYKIEDIQEHSTYKRWEDDLGSDGQVNAIYFMFAVCIISYISMLTRKEGSNKCKKVIIVDNPFGATSAVFLWNVMFEILKENNVQLIAPGHNINKEIISMFEVNYVLKHEYYEGNRKSVVVEQEIRTEDNLDYMNFGMLEGVQQNLFN